MRPLYDNVNSHEMENPPKNYNFLPRATIAAKMAIISIGRFGMYHGRFGHPPVGDQSSSRSLGSYPLGLRQPGEVRIAAPSRGGFRAYWYF